MGRKRSRAAVVLALVAVSSAAGACTFAGTVDIGASASSSTAGATSGGGSSGSTGACGAIQLVQAVPGTSEYQVQVNSRTQAQSITESAGDLLVAIAFAGQGPGSSIGGPNTSPNMTFTVSDSLGNSYAAAGMYENGNSHQAAVQIFFAPNIAGGANVVTVSTSAPGVPDNNYFTGLLLQEYSGMATTDVADLSAGQMAPSRTMPMLAGAITTRACDLIVGAYADGHVSATPMFVDGGFAFRSTDVWCPAGAVDDAPDGAAPEITVNPRMFLQSGADDGWVASQVAFRRAGTNAPPQPTALRFGNAPLIVQRGTCGGPVTVESVSGSSPAPSATGIALAVTGPAGVGYYVDSSCAYPLADAGSSELFIGAGTSARSFYIESATANPSATITVGADGGFPAISQTETVI